MIDSKIEMIIVSAPEVLENLSLIVGIPQTKLGMRLELLLSDLPEA